MQAHEDLLEATRRVAAERIAPRAAELDAGGWDPDVWTMLRDLQVFGMATSERYGGLGLPYAVYVRVIAAIARHSAVAALVPSINVLAARTMERFGPQEVRDAYVPPLASAEAGACWCFTEPGTGSDPKAILTTAVVRDGGGWSITGEKAFISHSSHASVAVVFAQLDGRLTAFIGRTDSGFHVGPREPLLAFGGADTGSVHLEDFHATHIVGDPGGGFAVLLAGEAEAKLRAVALSLGIAENALAVATDYARTRMHRGRPIGEKFQTLQWLIAECTAKTVTIRALLEHGLGESERGVPMGPLAASVKLIATRLAREVATDAVQVLGAYGVSKDYPAEMLYRQSKVYEVVQGVSEINRVIIAQAQLKAGDGDGR